MGSFFKDDKYEGMDFLTQAVRPLLWEPHEKFIQVPDEIEIEMDFLKETGRNLSINMTTFLKKVSKDYFGNSHDLYEVSKWFSIEVEKDTYIDLEKQEIIGSVKLVKKSTEISEQEILDYLAGQTFMDYRRRVQGEAKRAREIMELLGTTPESKKNSYNTLKNQVKDIIRENKLKIYNGNLILKMASWIERYVLDEDLQALANFSKLKVMTHKNEPIYSMKEIV
jgi:hypothetical protein